MGNTVDACDTGACDIPLSSKAKQLKMCLKPEQINLVKASWDRIKSDLGPLGLIVFVRFFELEPGMKSLFPKIVQMNQENKLEYDVDRETLQRHAVSVLQGLGAAIENLDDSRFLNTVLISIGQTHVHRRVKPQMLKKLWPALNYGLQQTLKADYTKPLADAWRKVYEYICVYMKMGMENPDLDAQSHLFYY